MKSVLYNGDLSHLQMELSTSGEDNLSYAFSLGMLAMEVAREAKGIFSD